MLYLLFIALAQAPIEITLDVNGVFRVTGWTGLPEAFSVRVDEPDVPEMLGTLRVDKSVLVFTPRYPLQPGVRYRASLNDPNGPPIVRIFNIPKPDVVPTTIVENVYPSANVLPENQLKFYIHFSAPMSRGEVYNRTHLLDENGTRIVLPFLELPEELWDREYRRLTLLFDPGRIKRGLLPNEEVGSPLIAGKKYTLVIDSEWMDATGKSLKTGFTKVFTVKGPDRKVIDLKTWQVGIPRSGTTETLSVDFPEPLDHALLERHLEVIDSNGNIVQGSIRIDREETHWSLKPEAAWKIGNYSLRIGTILADLAGNMIDRLFDVDIFDKVDEQTIRETRLIPFTVN
jgi:hypothetical protein